MMLQCCVLYWRHHFCLFIGDSGLLCGASTAAATLKLTPCIALPQVIGCEANQNTDLFVLCVFICHLFVKGAAAFVGERRFSFPDAFV